MVQRTVCLLLLVAALVTADVIQIQSSRDNTLIEPAGTEVLSNALSIGVYVGKIATGTLRRGLYYFDVSSKIPAGATVHSATLFLWLEKSRTPLPYITTVHKLLADWGEGTSSQAGGQGAEATTNDATWVYAKYPTTPWSSPGGDYVSAASSSAATDFALKYFNFTGLENDVSAWLNDPTSNFGWLLKGNEDISQSARQYGSREIQADRRPYLEVDFTPPTGNVGSCCLSSMCIIDTKGRCNNQGGVFGGTGTTCEPSTCGGSCDPATEDCSVGACCSGTTCSLSTQGSCAGSFQGAGTACLQFTCGISLTPFLDALPIPQVLQPTTGRAGGQAHYDLEINEFQQQLHSELPATTVWGYNGMFPGPTIEAWSNVKVTAKFTNNLRDTSQAGQPLRDSHYLYSEPCLHGPNFAGMRPYTATHLHGGLIRARFDGHPDFQVPPGQSDYHEFDNEQDAAMLWYHDHGLGITRLNVYMGLAGLYFVRDTQETQLLLPSGKFEVPLVVMDRSFQADGSLSYPNKWVGMFNGDHLLVNGKVTPYLEVQRTAYRFRILNGCGTRMLTLKPKNGEFTMYMVGNDRGLIKDTIPLTEVTMSSAERRDIIVDFSQFAAGTKITLVNTHPTTHQPGAPAIEENVMQFVVIDSKAIPYTVPASPKSTEVQLPLEASYPRRTFKMGQVADDKCGGKVFKINNLGWDDITEYPVMGTREVWRFVNMDNNHIHPMHLHLAEFQVVNTQQISKTGPDSFSLVGTATPATGDELGWRDIVPVMPLTMVRVIVEFPEGYAGRFPYHCHVLEHEDHDMMRQFHVVHSQCNKNGVCDATEDCYSCPEDCGDFDVGSRCGNGLCEAGDGENCGNCPQDCAGTIGGTCCGFGPIVSGGLSMGTATTGCDATICKSNGYLCRSMPQPKSCCGDEMCLGSETKLSCPIDCDPDEHWINW
eukprot:m.15602 g.15602  ORF g.15602 m.15602 type:complete len:935 (-) comp6677_c0_seq1:468-3272(-)